MLPAELIFVTRQALMVVLFTSLPVLAASAFVGVLVSALQTMTQLQDQVLSAVPRVLAASIALFVCGPWMGSLLLQLWSRVLSSIDLVQFR